ncbi:MAG: dTDP-4-dehydrorhamnose reductase, partial [Phycisphaerae bacterium]|nr:dTDP-4-dehydrorhamnose reductase [Phycisphaerae bacterium]
ALSRGLGDVYKRQVERNATLAFTINAHAVKAIAEACAGKNATFVHVSTDYVFDGRGSRPYREEDKPAPVNVYGASKAMGELLSRHVHDKTIIARVASLFGVAGASGKGGNFVETMIRVGREKGRLQVVNDITMSPTSTADVARMILDLLTEKAEPGIYHTVNSGQATWYEFAREIIARSKISAEVVPINSAQYPTAAMRPAYSVLDNHRTATVVGAIPSWHEALSRYLVEKGHAAEGPV